MSQYDFLIVGGSAAGTTAAEVIRSLLPQASIAILHDEDHEQYSRVLLPYYIRGKVPRQQVFLKKPEWYEQNRIELVKSVKAVGLDAKNHQVKASDGNIYKYGKMLIAIGGYVVKLDIPGANLGNILYMRTIEDADNILAQAKASKKAVVVGGGFIGLEFATSFRVNGVEDVTVLVMEDYYWQGKLDRDSSLVLQNTLEKNGVKILTNEEIGSFEPIEGLNPKNAVGAVKTKSGERFECEVVGIGIGIRSDLSWLERSEIKVDRGIITNEYLETNVPDIYAAGDCAEFHDVIFERQHIMGNWANATSQGLAVGKTITGQRTVFETASSYSINFFDPSTSHSTLRDKPSGLSTVSSGLRFRDSDSRNRIGSDSESSGPGGSCSFIGVTDESFADEVISRGSVEAGKMTRIFIKTINNVMRVVGATVINSTPDVSPLTTTVKNKVDVSKYKDQLSDSNFDLKNTLI